MISMGESFSHKKETYCVKAIDSGRVLGVSSSGRSANLPLSLLEWRKEQLQQARILQCSVEDPFNSEDYSMSQQELSFIYENLLKSLRI